MRKRITKYLLVISCVCTLALALVMSGCAAQKYKVTFNLSGTAVEGTEITSNISITKDGQEIQKSTVEGTDAQATFELGKGTYAATLTVYVTKDDTKSSITADPTSITVDGEELTIPVNLDGLIPYATPVSETTKTDGQATTTQEEAGNTTCNHTWLTRNVAVDGYDEQVWVEVSPEEHNGACGYWGSSIDYYYCNTCGYQGTYDEVTYHGGAQGHDSFSPHYADVWVVTASGYYTTVHHPATQYKEMYCSQCGVVLKAWTEED